MTPLTAWRRELQALLPCGFLRRAQGEDGLFVSDYSVRCREPEAIDRALRAAGFQITPMGRLRQIDGTAEKYRRFIAELPPVSLPAPTEETLYLWGLVRRLLAAQTPPERQPIAPIRLTLKCLDGGDAASLQRLLPPMLALGQRQGKPLPTAAGQLIAFYLKGDALC